MQVQIPVETIEETKESESQRKELGKKKDDRARG